MDNNEAVIVTVCELSVVTEIALAQRMIYTCQQSEIIIFQRAHTGSTSHWVRLTITLCGHTLGQLHTGCD